jgi:hypothetical protein
METVSNASSGAYMFLIDQGVEHCLCVTSNQVCYYDKMPVKIKPIDVPCPLCGASPGDVCVTKAGREFHRVGVPGLSTHVARKKWADSFPAVWQRAGFDVDTNKVSTTEPLQISRSRLPKKLKHRVRAREYAWCDAHGAVHPAQTDYYEEGHVYCEPSNWRRVYIESDDKTETF